MTSERSIAAINKAAGEERLTGETVRLIELPASHGDAVDVFDKPRATQKVGAPGAARRARIEALEQLLNDLQGTAARAFLRKLVRDKNAKRKLDDFSAAFMRKVESELSTRTDGRIAGHFAIVAAASRLAIEYGVLNWNDLAMERDVRVCLFDALASMKNGNSAPEQSDADWLSELMRDLETVKTLDLDGRDKSSVTTDELAKYEAFRRTLRGDKQPTLLLKTAWLKTRYAKPLRKRLLKLCVNAGIMSNSGRSADTHTHQEKIGGKPVEVYRITLPRT